MTGSHAVKMPTRKDLLVFGLLLPLFFALLGGWPSAGDADWSVAAAISPAVAAAASLFIRGADGEEAPGVCDST